MGSSQDYEVPAVLSAKAWWDNADWLETDLWKVQDDVSPHNLENHYVIESIYGKFEANGDHQLINRLKEIQAIHVLRGQSSAKAGGKGILNSAEKKLDVGKSIIRKPVKTAANVPRGALSILKRGGSLTRSERRKGNYGSTTGPVKAALGADGQKRKIAERLGINPYTDNRFLQTELDRVATLEAIPEFGLTVAIPLNNFFTVVETGDESKILDAYRSSPSDLFIRNRKTLIDEIGVPKSLTAQFLSLKHTTPAQQTILVESLRTLRGTRNRVTAIELATLTETREEFDFYKRNAELLAWYQKNRKPLSELIPFQGLVIGVDADNNKVLPFAVDLAGWCPNCGGLLTSFADAGKNETVIISGRLTNRAQAELKKRGVIVEHVKRLK